MTSEDWWILFVISVFIILAWVLKGFYGGLA